MPKYRFPQDRTTFIYTGPGEPIRQPGMRNIYVYLDQECTEPAPICDLNGDLIPGAVLVLGRDGLIPEFLGPIGLVELWAKSIDDEASYRLVVQTQELLEGGPPGPQGPPGPAGPEPDLVDLATLFDNILAG